MSNIVDLNNMASMDELYGAGPQPKPKQNENSIVKAKIVSKNEKGVCVDLGLKSEPFIDRNEFKNFDEIQIGDEVDVYLERLEGENSAPQVSVKKAMEQQSWDDIVNNHPEGSMIKGLVTSRVKGGLIVNVGGIEAFLPGSQVDVGQVHDLDAFVNQELDLKILKINNDRKNIVVSRRELLEAERATRRATLLEELQKGQIRKGIVKNITDFGAFVDLNGMDGLLHITDMSWGRVTDPRTIVQKDQEIEVMILDVDKERQRVSLGLKQKEGNPWDTVDVKYAQGTKVHGKIVNVMPYGAFVELEEGIEGLIHVTEMSWTKKVTRASDVVNIGDEVDAVVLAVHKDERKISLGLRQAQENPWELIKQKYPKGTRIKGKVRNMTGYGAFVQIQDDIDGMIHVSDMSWTRKINNPNELLKPGQEVEVVILEINPEQQRISLGLKQAENDPWANINELYKVGDKVKGKVSKIAQFGAFVELSNKIDGLIHISQISRDRVEKVKDVLKIGDEVEARVIKVDTDERRIGLSIKALTEDFSEADLKAAEEEYTAALKPGENMVDMGEVFNSANLKLE